MKYMYITNIHNSVGKRVNMHRTGDSIAKRMEGMSSDILDSRFKGIFSV